MTMNLYDVLDVPETASEQEIRAAWKQAIADLDPTERRFRAFNDAAGVLLDPDKRAEHDAELAAQRAAEERREEEAEAERAGAEGERAADQEQDEAQDDAQDDAKDDAKDEEPGDQQDDPDLAEESARSEESVAARGSAGPPGWALGAASVGAVVALVLAIYLFSQPGGRLFTDGSPREVAQQNSAAQRAIIAAEGAAEQMVGPVLSYNHETMAADLDRRVAYLSPDLAEKVRASWPELTEEAAAREIVVEATAAGVASTRVSKDARHATVLVFVNQLTKKKGEEPFELHMWATFDLARDAADAEKWLLEDVCVDSACAD